MADWSFIAEKTFTPDDLTEVIGSFSLEEGDDTLWVRLTQLSTRTSPWSYGILSWRSPEGHELGSVKAYGNLNSEVYRLGVGRAPSVRNGVITFTPRGFNLGWIKNGFPWPLKFEAASGGFALPTPEPSLGGGTLMVPAVPEGNAQPSYEILDGLALLFFNLFTR